MPTTKLPISKTVSSGAAAETIAPTKNTSPAASRVKRRPIASAMVPVTAAPRIQPTSTTLIVNSCCLVPEGKVFADEQDRAGNYPGVVTEEQPAQRRNRRNQQNVGPHGGAFCGCCANAPSAWRLKPHSNTRAGTGSRRSSRRAPATPLASVYGNGFDAGNATRALQRHQELLGHHRAVRASRRTAATRRAGRRYGRIVARGSVETPRHIAHAAFADGRIRFRRIGQRGAHLRPRAGIFVEERARFDVYLRRNSAAGLRRGAGAQTRPRSLRRRIYANAF